MRAFLLGSTMLAGLVGCTSFHTAAPEHYKTADYFYIEPAWLAQHKAELTARLVESIKEKHPTTAAWFPRVVIRSINIETSSDSWRNAPELTKQLNEVFEQALTQLYPQQHKQPAELTLDLKIRTASTEMNSALYALMLPYGVACFSTLMMVCPVTGEEIVVTEGTFWQQDKALVSLSAAGASRLVAVSPYAADGNEWGDEAATKALIAALSQLTDKFVAHMEKTAAAK